MRRRLECEAGRLRRLLEEHREDAWGWALTCCEWDSERAGDVFQDACLRVLDGRAQFQGRSEFRTWLFGVIRNVAREHRRRRRRERARLSTLDPAEEAWGSAPGPERPDEAAERTELASHLRQALARLPERQREVLHLVFYQGLSITGAAEVVGVEVGTARTHYKRGKMALKNELVGRWKR